MTKRPSTLASFAHTWVGGDINGLSAFSGTLYGYVSRIDDIVTAVNSNVSNMVSDAGWTGDAASAFQQAWTADARGAVALGAAIEVIGDTVDSLAVRLADLEQELESAAAVAKGAGVTINPDGTPAAIAPTPGHGMMATTTDLTNIKRSGAVYEAVRQQILTDAQQARVDAATTLENLFQQLAPGGPHGSTGVAAAVAEQLGGFWGVATPFNVKVARNARHLAGQGNVVEAAWTAEGGPVAEYGNESWVAAGGTAGARLAGMPEIAGSAVTVPAAGQSSQPWYEGISDESLASVTSTMVSGGVGGPSDAGDLSFVSPPMSGARVGAATGGVLSAGVGSSVSTLLDGDEGTGDDVGQSARNAKRLWNRVVQPAQ